MQTVHRSWYGTTASNVAVYIAVSRRVGVFVKSGLAPGCFRARTPEAGPRRRSRTGPEGVQPDARRCVQASLLGRSRPCYPPVATFHRPSPDDGPSHRQQGSGVAPRCYPSGTPGAKCPITRSTSRGVAPVHRHTPAAAVCARGNGPGPAAHSAHQRVWLRSRKRRGCVAPARRGRRSREPRRSPNGGFPGWTPGSTLPHHQQLFLYVRTIFPRVGAPTSYAAITS